MGRIVVALAFCVGCASQPRADEFRPPAPALWMAAEAGEGEREAQKRHSLSALARYVTEGRGDGGVAVGLEYEYLLSEKWGVGGFGAWESSVWFAVPIYPGQPRPGISSSQWGQRPSAVTSEESRRRPERAIRRVWQPGQ